MNLLDRLDTKIAGFVLKGQLAEISIQGLIQPSITSGELTFEEIYGKLTIVNLDKDAVADSKKMSAVYIAIASFENMVRELISNRLLEEKGADWWTTCVSKPIQKRAERKIEDESKIRWHQPRGISPIYFTELKDLISIIQNNWENFEDLLLDIDWVKYILKTIERSRNVIMHSGQLSLEDIERVGVNIRDWLRQVGT